MVSRVTYPLHWWYVSDFYKYKYKWKDFFVFLFSRVIHRWYVCDFYKYKYKRKDSFYFWSQVYPSLVCMWLLQIQIQKKGFFVFLFSRVIHRWYVCDFYKYKYNRKEFLYFWFLGLSIGGMYVTGVKSETQEGRLVWGRLPQHLPQIFNPFFIHLVLIVLIIALSVSP